MKFVPFPNIETNRLVLDQLILDDVKEVYFLRSNDNVIKYVDHPKAETLKDASDFIIKINNGIQNNEWIMWAIRIKGDPKLIGTICLWNFSEDKTTADIGFVLHPDSQRKGIMAEATTEILQFGFSKLKLKEICGEAVTENLASIYLMRKFGFQLKNKIDNISVYMLKRGD